MKRIFFAAVAAALCASLCFALASCGGAAEEAPAESKQRSSQAEDAEYEDAEDYEDEGYEGEDYESNYDDEEDYGDSGDDDGGNVKKNAGIGGIAGNYYTGLSGDESMAYTICLNVSSDGNNGAFAYGVPGASDFILGQLTYDGDMLSIHPLDGSDVITVELKDRGRGDGSLSYRKYNEDGTLRHEGWLDLVSKDEFDEAVDMLS